MCEESKDRKDKNTIIKLNDEYYLFFDSYCMWIATKAVAKKSGKERFSRVSGYHDNFASLMNSLDRKLSLKIKGITEVQELLEAQKQVHEEVIELCKGLKNIKELQK